MGDNDTTQVSDEVNVDELLAEVSKPTPEREMTSSEPPKAAEPPAWDGKPWEFDWNGKKVAPDSQEKAKTWMSQGYNYSQRMGEFNRSKADFDRQVQAKMAEIQQREQAWSPYQKVDEYAKKNPQWWQAAMQAYEQAQSQGGGQGWQQVDPRLQQIEQTVSQFQQFMQQQEQERLVQHQQRENQTLDQEIQSIRKDFPNIDLKSTDPQTGETLENRILKHASAMFGHLPEYKTGVFKAAFRDYLHDQLIEQAKASGREAIAKDAKADAKKGILGRTPAPMKATQPTAVRGKSYNDLAAEALRELGLTS